MTPHPSLRDARLIAFGRRIGYGLRDAIEPGGSSALAWWQLAKEVADLLGEDDPARSVIVDNLADLARRVKIATGSEPVQAPKAEEVPA